MRSGSTFRCTYAGGFNYGRGLSFFCHSLAPQNPAVADALMLGIVEGLVRAKFRCGENERTQTNNAADGHGLVELYGVEYIKTQKDVFQQSRRNTVDILLVVDDRAQWLKNKKSPLI